MTDNDEKVIDTFLDYIQYFIIAHHVPGKIRVKTSWFSVGKLKNIDGEGFRNVLNRISGIKDYQINKKALSAEIEYDHSVLSPRFWEEVVSLHASSGKRDEVREKLLALLV